jgi:hypothetical protein
MVLIAARLGLPEALAAALQVYKVRLAEVAAASR